MRGQNGSKMDKCAHPASVPGVELLWFAPPRIWDHAAVGRLQKGPPRAFGSIGSEGAGRDFTHGRRRGPRRLENPS
jgi:hypothetical protein